MRIEGWRLKVEGGGFGPVRLLKLLQNLPEQKDVRLVAGDAPPVARVALQRAHVDLIRASGFGAQGLRFRS